jgi:hypothetical protein
VDTPPEKEALAAPQTSRESVEQPEGPGDARFAGGRILDFLRANGVQTTPREEISQEPWKGSTPAEEYRRRMDELRWQYEPRIEVETINGGLFYLHSQPGSGRML